MANNVILNIHLINNFGYNEEDITQNFKAIEEKLQAIESKIVNKKAIIYFENNLFYKYAIVILIDFGN